MARVGRPRGETAAAHEAIMDAVYALLQEMPARDLTMEAVAKRAGVGKPTLYKWWGTKAALIAAMFRERLDAEPDLANARTAEAALRAKMKRFVGLANGLFGKVIADLIAEGQSDPDVLKELYDQHFSRRRAAAIADVERGKANGEFSAEIDSGLLIDATFGALYYRLLLKLAPITEAYGDALITQALKGACPSHVGM